MCEEGPQASLEPPTKSTPVKTLSDWATKHIFSYVHNNHLVYNTCWEDPRIDRAVMRLGASDDVVMITSAGCNALDYALDAPRSIHAVDMNFRQNALLELKIASIRHLEFEDFFSLFGDGGDQRFPMWYRDFLRSELSPSAQQYWDTREVFFSRSTPEDSFYHRGTTGVFGRFLSAYCRLNGILDTAVDLFDVNDVERQKAVYFEKIRGRFWRKGMKAALGTNLALSLVGVPLAQRKHLEETCAQSVADFMEDCMEAVFTKLPMGDNYFWRLYLTGRYSRQCCPEYLKAENFEKLKGGLVDCVQTHTCDLTTFLRQAPGTFSRCILLDHMDWLSTQRSDLLKEEWQALLDKTRPGAMFLWRSGGLKVDYVDPLEVEFDGGMRRLGDVLEYDVETARRWHALDRVHTYGSFYIAHLAA
jgi:S-adenosylmethionine-diacylglycerol 3-amino-3-carboxypropyl transferase